MLEKLLSEIRLGGTFEINSLASRLGTTPDMVKAMLDHLQRLGYIQAYHSCGESCGGCSLYNECRLSNGQSSSYRTMPLYVLVESPAHQDTMNAASHPA